MDLMEFLNIQFIASMNPTAGSFNINPRLQRHFWICSIPFPSDDSIRTIFQFFLDGHLKQFGSNIQELSKGLVAGIIKLHKCVYAKFKNQLSTSIMNLILDILLVYSKVYLCQQ